MSTERPSPIKNAPFYAEHKLERVQRYGYQQETHRRSNFENAAALFEFLGTPTFDELPQVHFSATVLRSDFFTNANSMSKSIKEKYFKESSSGLVVFKDTERKVPRGHVTDTKCKLDITAAFDDAFNSDDTTFWPCIRMAGGWASEGTPPEDQETTAISYLHYLLLARPDLYVAQGMLASEGSMMFLVGIGGSGIRRLKIRWDDKELSKLLYAFIYRTYYPAHFADSSYELDPIVDDRPTWTITIGVGDGTAERPVPCRNFLPLYASSPFEMRTHVFVAKGEGVDVDGKELKVLKDQVYRIGNRFNEGDILELVHKPKRVPGVVEAVYHKSIKLPSQLDDLNIKREKHRHGLRQFGRPFASIPTVKEMLQVAFDLVEVLRFVRAERNILHRDISIGNVMYIPQSAGKQSPDTSTEGDEVLSFCDSFLSDMYVCGTIFQSGGNSLSPEYSPRPTSVLLVDFNHAEHLTNKIDDDHKRVARTVGFIGYYRRELPPDTRRYQGTPVFMARAVELGQPLELPPRDGFFNPILSLIPSAPDRYVSHYHDTRLKEFPPTAKKVFDEAANSAPWRHELDHDVESVFWLMLYWAMTARPEGGAADLIAPDVWGLLTGGALKRQFLLEGFLRPPTVSGAFHPTFQPLQELFRQLAGILCSIDRHWLQGSKQRADPRNNPEYFAEAFQRLILQFLINHNGNGDKNFMNQTIDSNPRQRQQQSPEGPLSSTSNQRSHATSESKRASTATEESDSKRRSAVEEPETDRNSMN
ncbi:hypothetical protein FRC01_014492 [Tulasnella sp. 417]|nr:hypothetical protein FRC01_014492 [Tulasnella sp. 417]